MTKEIIAKPFAITADLDGISPKAITEHFKLYEGYVKKTNEIRAKLTTADKSLANASYSEIGELKRQESFTTNGVKLHEIYFGILGLFNTEMIEDLEHKSRVILAEAGIQAGSKQETKNQNTNPAPQLLLERQINAKTNGNGEPIGKVAEMIIRDFGSIQDWITDMTAAGLSARGWVITAYDEADQSLHNYSADAHNVGIIAGTIPLVVLDVYEHAYFMDYGVNRRGYIEAFFKNLNWEAIDKMAEVSQRMSF